MLFHIGAVLRFKEAGISRRLDRASSSFSGSITAGVLGMNWKHLEFQSGTVEQGVAASVVELLGRPVRRIAPENDGP